MENNKMNYVQAVTSAREGKEEGFTFLYESTYKEKYYIAIKYMKNEEKAQDILQDAYIKAFNKLDTLKDPNAFPGWIGQIVANTAKNALIKKNPLLFSEMEGMDDGSFKWEEQIEDDNQYYQPEEAYTTKETQEMVHELLGSLSDEQRLCMLMFYIEEQSIKDIAKTFNCSENTVKSRLNYGRKKLKSQAEVLQQKGYKLYSFAPAPLLLYLLQSEKELFISTENTVLATTLYTQIASHVKMTKIAGKGIREGLKQTFIHTTAGKITVAVVGLVLVGTMAAGTVWYQANNLIEADKTGSSAEDVQVQWMELTDEVYPNLINGNLTKEQLEFMLGYGPLTMTDGYVDDKTLGDGLVEMLSQVVADKPFNCIGMPNTDNNGRVIIATAEINRIFSVFTDNAFTSDFSHKYITVANDTVAVSRGTSPWSYKATITKAEYLDDNMVINYVVTYIKPSPGSGKESAVENYTKTAYLKKQASGLFQIKKIVDGEENETKQNEEKQNAEEQNTESRSGWKKLYVNQLEAVKAGESAYRATLPSSWSQSAVVTYEYALVDIDKNRTPELIVNTIVDGLGTCGIYTVSDDQMMTIKLASDETISSGVASAGGYRAYLSMPADGTGLYFCSYASYSPDVDVKRLTKSASTLVQTKESIFQMKTDAYNAFTAENKEVTWTDSGDLQAFN